MPMVVNRAASLARRPMVPMNQPPAQPVGLNVGRSNVIFQQPTPVSTQPRTNVPTRIA